MIEDLRQQQIEHVRRKKREGRWKVIIGFVLILSVLVAVLSLNAYRNKTFEITYYNHSSQKIEEPFKIALLCDLHNGEFGSGNWQLIQAIAEEEPDLILIAGDMVNLTESDVSVAVSLCEKLAKLAPTYYCYGNHEGTLMHNGIHGIKIPIDQYVEDVGAVFFRQSFYHLEIKGNSVDLGAISTGLSGYEQWGAYKAEELEAADDTDFKILVSHHPDLYYEKLKKVEVDLALAGHYHGGQIRIPGLGGLYHPSGGFFPKYDGGSYQLEYANLIVSRGLGNHSLIPRINNKPELVIINVCKDEEEIKER